MWYCSGYSAARRRLHPRFLVVWFSLALGCLTGMAPPLSAAAEKLTVYSGRAERLIKPVLDTFTAKTGIAIRHDLTEDNEIKPRIWAAVAQGRVPPIHVNWDTTANATSSALRGVCEDLSDLPNLAKVLPLAKPIGLGGVPIVNLYSYVYVLAYRPEAFPAGPPSSWNEAMWSITASIASSVRSPGSGQLSPAAAARRSASRLCR